MLQLVGKPLVNLIKPEACNLIKKRLRYSCFPVNIAAEYWKELK